MKYETVCRIEKVTGVLDYINIGLCMVLFIVVMKILILPFEIEDWLVERKRNSSTRS